MSIPYSEGWVIENQQLVKETYDEAFRPLDLNNVVWSNRMLYSATSGRFSKALARWWHLNELRDELNKTPLLQGQLRVPRLPFPNLTSSVRDVRVDGLRFADTLTNETWPYAGSTDFLLYLRFLRGENIAPVLTQRVLAGANLVNVFSLVPGDGGWPSDARLHPTMFPAYYAVIPAFVQQVENFGMRVEVCLFTREDLMPDLSLRLLHAETWRRQLLAAGGKSFVRLYNERHESRPEAFTKPSGLVSCIGTAGGDADPPLPPWDYSGHEPRRDWKAWVATSDIFYAIHGYPGEDGRPGYPGTQQATVSLEPIGFQSVPEPGRRSSDPALAATIGADCVVHGAGGTFHSSQGVLSNLWDDVTLNCAQRFYQALHGAT